MNALTWFGLFAVTAMVVCYALEKRSTWFILGFAAACVLGSVYGFLQGAWPFGPVEGLGGDPRCAVGTPPAIPMVDRAVPSQAVFRQAAYGRRERNRSWRQVGGSACHSANWKQNCGPLHALASRRDSYDAPRPHGKYGPATGTANSAAYATNRFSQTTSNMRSKARWTQRPEYFDFTWSATLYGCSSVQISDRNPGPLRRSTVGASLRRRAPAHHQASTAVWLASKPTKAVGD